MSQAAQEPGDDRGQADPRDISGSPRQAMLPVRVYGLILALVCALIAVVVIYFFSAFKVLFLGVLAAAAVAALLKPLADRVPGPRGLAAVVVGFGFFLLCASLVWGLGVLLADPIRQEMTQWPETRGRLDTTLGSWSASLGVDPPVQMPGLLKRASGIFGGGGGAGQVAAGAADALFDALIALAFIFIGSIYFLAAPSDQLIKPVLPALPPRRRPQVLAALHDLGPKLRWWLIGVLVSMTIVGVVSGVGYWIAGLKFAIPLAILSALAELVPTVGPLLSFLVALVFASTQGSTQVAGAVVVWAVVQTLESYVILPLVMRRAVKIPAVVTLFTVVFWGKVFGAAGLFLAIPINLVLWSFADHLLIRPSKAAEQGLDKSGGRVSEGAAI